jgi:hypothetical protein
MPFTDLDPKDPNDTDRFKWDLSDMCIASETTMSGATIVEVDATDTPVLPPTVTISGLIWNSTGIVTALIGGGTAGTSVLLRCRASFTNEEQRDRTIKVRISHL